MDTLSSRTLFVKLSEPQPLGALGIPPIGRGFIEDRKSNGVTLCRHGKENIRVQLQAALNGSGIKVASIPD
jgi:hypothetical protein